MRVSSLILGAVVDFDLHHDCALFELLAVNGSGEHVPVGHFSRRTTSNGTTRTTYSVSLNIHRQPDTPPTHYDSPFREDVLRWALWRLMEAERPKARRRRRVEPRPHGAPVEDRRGAGKVAHRVQRLAGVAVSASV